MVYSRDKEPLATFLRELLSTAHALAMDCTKCSSSAFLQPHQLTSGWPQRAITAPVLWCLQVHETQRVMTEQARDLWEEMGSYCSVIDR